LPTTKCGLSAALLIATFGAARADSVKYTYDSAGRLVKADYGSGAIAYTYDKSGNLTQRTVTGGGAISSVNVAGSPASAGIVQNGWIEIHGSNLVPSNTPAAGVIWSNAPEFAQGNLPTQIGGVSVTVNGKAAYVYFYCSSSTSSVCSTDQVNALTPFDNVTGPIAVVVTSNGAPSAPFQAALNKVVPSFLLFNANGYVAATHADNSLLGPASLYPGSSTPAAPNETITVYGVGWGLPSQTLIPGSSAQSGTLAPLPVCTIGGKSAAVLFAGLISPGLYQFNLTVPASATSGDNAISCSYAGASTPAGDLLTVR
jgi:uncharacterized protein (TIGR03437 family)